MEFAPDSAFGVDLCNEAMKEHDHAPPRETIAAMTRQTGLKVLLCPEDQSQMEVGKEMLFDKLPDEAVSTYVRSAGRFGNEMHSPIRCLANSIPALVCRWREQTSKGFMWRDIGLGASPAHESLHGTRVALPRKIDYNRGQPSELCATGGLCPLVF
jgi:hypothetical protein